MVMHNHLHPPRHPQAPEQPQQHAAAKQREGEEQRRDKCSVFYVQRVDLRRINFLPCVYQTDVHGGIMCAVHTHTHDSNTLKNAKQMEKLTRTKPLTRIYNKTQTPPEKRFEEDTLTPSRLVVFVWSQHCSTDMFNGFCWPSHTAVEAGIYSSRSEMRRSTTLDSDAPSSAADVPLGTTHRPRPTNLRNSAALVGTLGKGAVPSKMDKASTSPAWARV
jgi:hypothetical protein